MCKGTVPLRLNIGLMRCDMKVNLIRIKRLNSENQNSGSSLSFIFSLLFLLMFAGTAYAGPPVRPMVISGEALAEGKPLLDGTVLKFMVGQFDMESKVIVSEEGISYVRMVIPAFDPDRKEIPGGRDGDLVMFTSAGPYPLGDMPTVKWKKGLNLRRDFFVKQAIRERPAVASASSVYDGRMWVLKCSINPITQKGLEPSSVSYRTRWFYIKKTAGGEQPPDGKTKLSVFIKEDVLKDIKPGAEATVQYKDKPADLRRSCRTALSVLRR